MGKSANAVSVPFKGFPMTLRPKSSHPPIVEHALGAFFLFCDRVRKDGITRDLQDIERLSRQKDLAHVDEQGSFLRWYDETRILEVHGVFLAAPNPAP